MNREPQTSFLKSGEQTASSHTTPVFHAFWTTESTVVE